MASESPGSDYPLWPMVEGLLPPPGAPLSARRIPFIFPFHGHPHRIHAWPSPSHVIPCCSPAPQSQLAKFRYHKYIRRCVKDLPQNCSESRHGPVLSDHAFAAATRLFPAKFPYPTLICIAVSGQPSRLQASEPEPECECANRKATPDASCAFSPAGRGKREKGYAVYSVLQKTVN